MLSQLCNSSEVLRPLTKCDRYLITALFLSYWPPDKSTLLKFFYPIFLKKYVQHFSWFPQLPITTYTDYDQKCWLQRMCMTYINVMLQWHWALKTSISMSVPKFELFMKKSLHFYVNFKWVLFYVLRTIAAVYLHFIPKEVVLSIAAPF